MMKSTILFLIVSVVLAESEIVPKESKINALIIDNIEEFKTNFPNALIEELKSDKRARGSIRYTLGNRLNGDRPVATARDSKSYVSPQDVQLKLSYPVSGVGAFITYVDVLVNQSTNLGRGYILSGGIGQRSIVIVIEAKNTSYFQYEAVIYGY